MFFSVKMVDLCTKLSPFSLFALYVFDNLVHFLLQLGTFHAIIRSMQGNCCPSLAARVTCMHRAELLKDQCFDFTDGFKHSELSHFAL